MFTQKATGRILGLLFILVFVFGGFSQSLRGLSSSLTESTDFMKTVFSLANEMKASILLDLAAAAISLLVATLIFPFFRRYNVTLALAYISLWIVHFGVIISSNISHFSLISLSEKFASSGSSNIEFYNLLGYLRVEDYFWAHILSLLVFSFSDLLLYYFLFQTKLVPRLLAAWGFVAVAIVFVATLFQFFKFEVSMLFYIQNALYLVVLTVWLLIKGFDADSARMNDTKHL